MITARVHHRQLGNTKDNLEIFFPVVYITFLGAVGFVTASFSVLFYFQHKYVFPIMSNFRVLNVIIICFIGVSVFVNIGALALIVSTAAIYGNSANIWLKYLR